MNNPITIDGSYGEGGGSIIRFSMAYSAYFRKHVKIINIRSNRKNPGLRTQHLTGIKLINQIKGGILSGGHVGSTTIEYVPSSTENRFDTNDYIRIDINTAASIGLIFQALIIALIGYKKKIEIEINGGATYGAWAPSITYVQNITLEYLKKFGINNFEIDVIKHGFYPKGGAIVKITYNPTSFPKFKSNLNLVARKSIKRVNLLSISSKSLKRSNVAERQISSSIKELKKGLGNIDIDSEIIYVKSSSPGSGLTLWTDSEFPFGSSIVGKKGLLSEQVAETFIGQFSLDWKRGGIIDKFQTDQLIPLLAFNPSSSFTSGKPLSSHTKTNIWIAKHFFNVEFVIKKLENDLLLIKSITQD